MWIEEPFAMGPAYSELKARTRLSIAGGELFWGRARFEEIADNAWVDVIMPDVKHVGGFGPLLDVLEMAAGRIDLRGACRRCEILRALSGIGGCPAFLGRR